MPSGRAFNPKALSYLRVISPALKLLVGKARHGAQVMRAGELEHRSESFELFGFDVMVDEAIKVWLLEVNKSPGCESRTCLAPH